MNTNILDYMYDGYGYDMDNQMLYTDVEKYNEALDADGYSDNGMKTLSSKDLGVLGHEDYIETEKANEYKEVQQFVSENGANYTDLRPAICACGGSGRTKWAFNDNPNIWGDDNVNDGPDFDNVEWPFGGNTDSSGGTTPDDEEEEPINPNPDGNAGAAESGNTIGGE